MLTPVQEAIEISLSQAPPAKESEEVALPQAGGRVLAEDVFSDLDMPPFDKSAMDGYALRADDLDSSRAVLDVVATIPAGSYPDISIASGQAAKIMTGAPVPAGADSVQMVEKTAALPGDKVRIDEPVPPGKHIARQGEVLRSGEKALDRGTYITSAVIGLLATVGKDRVRVFRAPTVSILVTGDELVEVHEKPALGQIRNSNGHALRNQVAGLGATPKMLGVVTDTVEDLRSKIREGLEGDVLLITGGVSMGEFDFVEAVLDELGVRFFFTKVNIKPGKPTVFGKSEKTLVFGLPGNPVSTSTVFEVMVRPVLRKMMGLGTLHNPVVQGILQADFVSKTNRESYQPALTSFDGQCFRTRPVSSRGSADVQAFAQSNSLLVAPPDVYELAAGQSVSVMLEPSFWQGGHSVL